MKSVTQQQVSLIGVILILIAIGMNIGVDTDVLHFPAWHRRFEVPLFAIPLLLFSPFLFYDFSRKNVALFITLLCIETYTTEAMIDQLHLHDLKYEVPLKIGLFLVLVPIVVDGVGYQASNFFRIVLQTLIVIGMVMSLLFSFVTLSFSALAIAITLDSPDRLYGFFGNAFVTLHLFVPPFLFGYYVKSCAIAHRNLKSKIIDIS
ncbi:MAG: hypothetical protein NT150_11740 [Bacteroidetes bacterium]|nr:hypothetical protein [Bacteroidota bacterium]